MNARNTTADNISTRPEDPELDGTLIAEPAAAAPITRDRLMVAIPLVGIAAGAGLALGGRGVTRKLGLGLAFSSLLIAGVRWQMQRFFTKEVPYEIESLHGDLEIRVYPTELRAETVVESATWADALEEGFQRLAAYVFGDGGRTGEKIAMTAPVVATLGGTSGDRSRRTIAFMLPSDVVRANLPSPQDARVRVREVPRHRVAVLRFSGRYRGGLPAEKSGELIRHCHRIGLVPRGEVSFAAYDPPWTLPWLRRNEVMVRVVGQPMFAGDGRGSAS